MLSGKQKQEERTVAGGVAALEWPDHSRKIQSCWVSVNSWDFKVFPSRAGTRWGKFLFQFEGRISRPIPLASLAVVGEIETLDKGEEYGIWGDYWSNVPANLEGWGSLVDADGSNPLLGLTLFCSEEALDWVYRAFQTGFSDSANTGVGLDISLIFPDPCGPDFWKDEWRAKHCQVGTWKVFSGVTAGT